MFYLIYYKGQFKDSIYNIESIRADLKTTSNVLVLSNRSWIIPILWGNFPKK
jgi:hypothetical protein